MGNGMGKEQEICLRDAAREGNLTKVKNCIKQGAHIDSKDDKGRTPLHVAASQGHCNIVEYLYEQGVDVSIKDNDGMTPLHVVTEKLKARFSIVKYLVDKGVGINTQDHSGQTPLHTAAAKGHDNTVLCLIKNGADKSITDKQGRTPQDVANKKIAGIIAGRVVADSDDLAQVPTESKRNLQDQISAGHNWRQLCYAVLIILLLVIGIGLWWLLGSAHILWPLSEHGSMDSDSAPSEEL